MSDWSPTSPPLADTGDSTWSKRSFLLLVRPVAQYCMINTQCMLLLLLVPASIIVLWIYQYCPSSVVQTAWECMWIKYVQACTCMCTCQLHGGSINGDYLFDIFVAIVFFQMRNHNNEHVEKVWTTYSTKWTVIHLCLSGWNQLPLDLYKRSKSVSTACQVINDIIINNLLSSNKKLYTRYQ